MSDPTAAQDAEDARLAAMRRASSGQLPPARIGVDPNSPGGEDPNHTSTNVEPTSIGGLNPFNSTAPYNPAPQVSTPGATTATGPATTGQQNVSSNYAGTPGAMQRALSAQATAGGPPPGFTGTFNGTQYTNGQPAGSAPVNPTTAATSGSLGPTSVPTSGSGSGSLAPALAPRPAAPATGATGATMVPVAQTGTNEAATPAAAPGAGTSNIDAPQLADKAIVNGVEVWAGGPNSGQPTATTSGELVPGGQGGGALGALTNGIMSQLQQIQQSLSNPGTSTDVSATYMKSAQSILAMLDQQEAQLKADNAKQGTTIDPATQFTIDKLRETLDTNLRTMKEDLNRRGLSDSGIQLELENRLTKGSASDQAGLLADRLSKLQDQLQQGLTSIRTQKYSTANQFGLAGANAQTQWDENSRKLQADRQQNALAGMLSLRGQMSSAETARLGEIAAGQRASASETAAMARALVAERGANARNSETIAGENSRSAATIAAENARAAATRATTATTATTAQQRAATVSATQSAIENDYETSGDAISAVEARKAAIIAQVGTAGYNAILNHAAQLPSGKGIGGNNRY